MGSSIPQRSASPLPPRRILTENPFASQLTPEYKQNLKKLEPSIHFAPQAMDTDRNDSYRPRNAFSTPVTFPSLPLPEFDDPLIFTKFDTDTLFFVFYFQQGTPQQYLAVI